MLASMRGLTSMVVLLLKSGLKPEAEDTFYTHFDGSKVSAMSKNTSLIIACKFGHEKAAEALIAPTKAANALDARSASGATARITRRAFAWRRLCDVRKGWRTNSFRAPLATILHERLLRASGPKVVDQQMHHPRNYRENRKV